MNKNNWNIEELRKLFVDKYGGSLLPRLEQYLSTIGLKHERINYHLEKIKQIWEEIYKSKFISSSDESFQKAVKSSIVEAEAVVQILHSLGDILAQVVNLAIFGPDSLAERNVSLDKVLHKIKSAGIALEVTQALSTFKNSYEFRYIDAFCNTVKHRRLIDGVYSFQITKEHFKQGIRFNGFSYNGSIFPIIWFDIISEEYKLKIYDLLCDVGCAINQILK